MSRLTVVFTSSENPIRLLLAAALSGSFTEVDLVGGHNPEHIKDVSHCFKFNKHSAVPSDAAHIAPANGLMRPNELITWSNEPFTTVRWRELGGISIYTLSSLATNLCEEHYEDSVELPCQGKASNAFGYVPQARLNLDSSQFSAITPPNTAAKSLVLGVQSNHLIALGQSAHGLGCSFLQLNGVGVVPIHNENHPPISHELSHHAYYAWKYAQLGDWESFGKTLDKAWMAERSLIPSNTERDLKYAKLRSAGAWGGRPIGAGYVFCPLDKVEQVKKCVE